jgi:hypothetical protein
MSATVVVGDTLSREDAEHLRLLSIFHYVVGGLQAVFACVPILHLVMGAFMIVGPGVAGRDRVPVALMGSFFVAFAAIWILLGWTLAACMVLVGRSLTQRRRRLFCLVVAGVEAALCMPFGTVLGIFTILVLVRPSVRQAFG